MAGTIMDSVLTKINRKMITAKRTILRNYLANFRDNTPCDPENLLFHTQI